MNWKSDRAFNEIPLLPPEVDLESTAILKACISARAALAELKQAGLLLPNQELLINLLPILEAKDSSEIENIVTTADKLFRYAAEDGSADAATKEALRYRSALHRGYLRLGDRPLITNTAIEICSAIKEKPMKIRTMPGVALVNQSTGKVTYTPPEGEDLIRDLLAN